MREKLVLCKLWFPMHQPRPQGFLLDWLKKQCLHCDWSRCVARVFKRANPRAQQTKTKTNTMSFVVYHLSKNSGNLVTGASATRLYHARDAGCCPAPADAFREFFKKLRSIPSDVVVSILPLNRTFASCPLASESKSSLHKSNSFSH